MRKIYLLLMAMVCIASGSMAQINIANYSFNSSTGNTYTPITGGTVLATTGYDNTVSTAITMGGTFPFGGTNQTTCYISSNGFITFGAAPSATTYTPMSTIGTTTGAIAAFGQDAGTDAVASPNAEIRYQNLGTEFVVQYKDHANYYNRTTEKLNFQIRLTYATGAINIIYGTCTNPGTVSTTGTTPQVGIRGNSVTFSTNVNNLYLKDVPTGTTCNWADAVNGFSNASNLLFSGTTNVNVNIPSGLQYTWTPGTQAPVRAIAAPTSITSSGATVSWTAPTGATTYNVQYRIPGTCAWTNWSGNPVSATTLNLTGLASNTTYQVRIQAVNGAAVSTYSFINGTTATSDGYTTTGTFTTLPSACSGTPTAGTHPVTLFNLCPTSTASLTVAGQTTGVTGLTYQWEQADDAAFTTNVQNAVGGTGATTLSYTTPAYTSGTLYYRLKITCINGGSSATTATPVQVTGPVAPTTQASAIVIPAATLLNTSATINWTNGSGGRRFVVVNTTNSFTDPVGNSDVTGVSSVYAGGEQKVYDGTASTISVTGLTAGTTYYVRVYEYLRCTGTPNTNYYNITTATGNPNSFTTTTPPANDDCATSINLTPQNYVALPTCPSGVSGTTVGANTSSVTTPPSIDFFTSQDDDVWYDFVATNTTHYVRLCNVTYPIGAVVNMGLVVTNGCTGTSVETISTPTLSTVTIAASGGSGELAYTGLTIGTTYKIRVLTSGTTSRANFQISVLNPQPMTYVSSTTTQSSTATVTAGSTTQQIVRLEVTVIGGASPLSISQIDFNTNGTTSGAATTDIANAKVYYTGTSTTFATTTQFGSTVSAPNGIFNVSGTPQVLTGGLTNTVNYFWLVYDIPCTANVSDVVDAECTGFNIGSVQIPTVTAPAGTRAITALYAPTRTDGNSTTAIIQGTTNAPFVYTNISGSAACPGNITNVDFTVSGTAPATDILQAKCYYTTTSTFATTTPFGTAIANPAAGTISFTGTQALVAGTGNYFWLVYDVSCTATPTNTLNGDVSAIYLNGSVTPVAAITGTATTANAISASTGYSTINDGDWNSPSTWACGTVPPPPACNSTATIIINNNITVTTSGAVGANITVAAGKTLTISGGDLTLGCTSASGGTGGSNKLLTVNGTLTITGGTLNVNGGVAFGGVTSAFNMSGGTLNLDPNDGTAAGSFASTNGGFYLTTGLVNLTGGNINFLDPMYTATSGTGQSVFGYSHSSIDALSTTGCTITFGGGDDQNTLNTNGFYVESNLSTGTFELGNVIIAGGRTAAKRQVTTRQGVTNYITKFKNLTINSGAELLLTSGSAPLSITGNLINNGIFTNEAATASGSGLYFADLQYSAGVVTFPLNTAQSVSGTGFFKKLTADADPTAQTGNTLAGMYLNHLRTSPGVTLNVPLTVTSWLALINGKINTTTSNILALGNGTSLAGYGSGLTETPGTLYGSGFTTYTTAASYVGGWVNGPFNRWYSAATTLGQQGISPVGSDTSRPSQILYTTAPTTAGYLQSQWYDGTGTTSFTNPVINQTGVTPTLINAATNAYWRVEPATVLGVIGGTYTASMNDNNANAVLSFANTVLLKRPTAGGDWEDNGAGAPIGIHIASTGTNTDVTVNRSGLNTFSQFAIGGGLGTLPVAITNVTALITGSTNTVYWTTATEANNRKFVVERSVNGNNFTAIGEVATRAINGNSNTALQYSFVDANPVQGKAFYRLQMVDNNTRATYSQIVTLRRGAGKLEIVDVRPNPTTGTVYFNVLGTSTNVNVAVRDLSGKEVIRKSLVQSNSFSIDMSKLANGMYILEAVDVRSNEKAVFKVVKQ